MGAISSTDSHPLVWSDQGNNRVRFQISQEAGKAKRVIYGFFADDGSCIGVGATTTTLACRMSSYCSKISNALNEPNSYHRPMVKALADRVGAVSVRILLHVPADESTRDAEIRLIATYKPLFNSNKGGGGGTSASSPSYASRYRSTTGERFNPLSTPDKYYPFVTNPKTGRQLLDLTPNGRKLRHGVYSIISAPAGTNPDDFAVADLRDLSDNRVERYYGMTGRRFPRRIYEHTRTSDRVLLAAGWVHSCDENEDPGAAEAEIIAQKRKDGVNLGNKRAGGGGGRTS